MALEFAGQVVVWQQSSGRHGLPWQGSRDPYRVWLSEIMLQQTQVATVLPFYQRFLERFPDVGSLAQASLDEVLALWSGLGYYSRARHLHRCAQAVMSDWGGRFPATAVQLEQLPGIGRSTASAIAAFCFSERVAILDGNVRRVLGRYLAWPGDLAQASAIDGLWRQAEQLLPAQGQDMPAYTQGLMDLGATVCTRSRPQCSRCPVALGCAAHQAGQETAFPLRTRRLTRRTEAWWWPVVVDAAGRVLLQQRPATGIWAGLWCPPMLPAAADVEPWLQHAGFAGAEPVWGEVIAHALTHREWRLHPVVLRLDVAQASLPVCAPWPAGSRVPDVVDVAALKDRPNHEWRTVDEWSRAALPAPVRVLLLQLR